MIVQHQTTINESDSNHLVFIHSKSNVYVLYYVLYIKYVFSLTQKLFAGNKTRNYAASSKCCVIPVLSTRGYAHV